MWRQQAPNSFCARPRAELYSSRVNKDRHGEAEYNCVVQPSWRAFLLFPHPLTTSSMAPPTPDYSVYLVTARSQVPAGVDYLDALRAALKGGVTLVQIREKDVETDEFLDIARKSLAVCDEVSAERREHREMLQKMEEKGCAVLPRD